MECILNVIIIIAKTFILSSPIYLHAVEQKSKEDCQVFSQAFIPLLAYLTLHSVSSHLYLHSHHCFLRFFTNILSVKESELNETSSE